MTTPNRTREEIRDDLLRKLHPFDFTSVSDYDTDRGLIDAALREVADAAKQEQALLIEELRESNRQLGRKLHHWMHRAQDDDEDDDDGSYRP